MVRKYKKCLVGHQSTLSAIYCIQMRWSAICLMRVCGCSQGKELHIETTPRARLTWSGVASVGSVTVSASSASTQDVLDQDVAPRTLRLLRRCFCSKQASKRKSSVWLFWILIKAQISEILMFFYIRLPWN